MSPTPTESMVSLPAHDACEPSPRVLQRRADDVAYMTTEALAAKLERVGHKLPDIQMTSEESRGRACAIAGISPDEETQSMRRFLRARDAYRQELARGPSFRSRLADAWDFFCANVWPRISHAAIGMGIVLATAIALIVGCAVTAKAVEVPDAIIRGLVMVETGATWKNIGDISGEWSTGAAGEISHFQLSDDALRQMKVEDKAARIRKCPVLAESYARAFLVICYEKRGNWRDALATYNAWSQYRSRRARDYADRVLALASVL